MQWNTASAAAVLIFINLGFADAVKQDSQAWWPHFHGPNRDNISADTGLLEKWPESGPALAWKFTEAGQGFSGVSLANGMIFTAGDFGDVEMVLALDNTGKLLWKSPNGPSWTGPYPGSRTTPAYYEGMLYHMNPTGRLAAYEAPTGKEVWALDLCAKFGARYGTWAMTENVAVEGDVLYCTPGAPGALFAALNRKTGETIWTNAELDETAAYCSPILVTHGGRRLLITLTQRSVVALDTQTGKMLWTHPHETPNDQNVTAPIFADGYVFVTSGHRAGSRVLKMAPDAKSVTEVWWNDDLDNCHGGVILHDGCLYGSACRSGGKGFFCADWLTGIPRFRDKRMGKFSVTFADGMLYGLTQEGDVLLVKPGKEQIEVVSQFHLPDKSDELAFCHPVVCGGRLYLRQGGNVYAYDVRAR